MINFGALTGAFFFVALLGFALTSMLIFPKLKAGHALLCSCCATLFISFYGVIALQLMTATALVLMLGGIVCFVAGIIALIMNLHGLRRRVLTPGMLLYVLGSIAFTLLSTHVSVAYDHDALSYWARIVKELFTYHRFPIHADTTMFHSDYIPLFASLQYCVVHVFGWQDPYLSYVIFACMLTSACAIGDHVKSKFWGLVLGGLSLYAIRIFGFTFSSLRADAPMVMLFSAAALCLITDDEDRVNSWLPALLVASVIAGTKIYSGLMFAVVLVSIMFFKTIKSTRRLGREHSRPLLIISITALLLAIIMQLSWSGLYNYNTAIADYENLQATAIMQNVAASGERPMFSLRYLFSGNPRTSALSSSLTPENLQNVGGLIAGTWTSYMSTKLPYAWFFVLALVLLAVISPKKERSYLVTTLVSLLIMALIYVLGLFASYFVQSETSGAATTYLITASTPLLIAGLFYTVRAISSGAKKTSRVGLVLIAGLFICMYSITTPGAILNKLVNDRDAQPRMNIAQNFYENEIADFISPEDSDKHALLLECSYEASQIHSSSSKTHSYQYYGMPLRVHVFQYGYEDGYELESISRGYLLNTLADRRCELLILRIEDDAYFDAIVKALNLDPNDYSTGVYDIIGENGELSLLCRKAELQKE